MKQQAAQVYFPISLYMEIKQISGQEGTSMAAWIRELASREIKKKNLKKKSLANLPTFQWAEDEPNLSEHIDDVLYGDS